MTPPPLLLQSLQVPDLIRRAHGDSLLAADDPFSGLMVLACGPRLIAVRALSYIFPPLFTKMTALHVASGCANSLGAASSGARHSFPQRLSSHNSSCLRHLSPPEPTFLQILLCAGAVDEAFALADDAASCLPAGGVVPWLDTLLAEARTLASSSIFFSMIAGSGNARMVPPHCLIGRVRLHGRA